MIRHVAGPMNQVQSDPISSSSRARAGETPSTSSGNGVSPGADNPAEGLKIIAEEEVGLRRIQERLARPRQQTGVVDIQRIVREMERLREDIPGANDDERPGLLMQFERLGHQLDQHNQAEDAEQVDPDKPYFAHMRLQEGKVTRDVYLGRATRLDQGLRIVDWRNAPVSSLFYRYQEGDEYDEEFGGREVEGEMIARRTLTIVDGELIRLQAPQGQFVKIDDSWVEVFTERPKLAGGAGEALKFHTSRTGVAARMGSGKSYRVDKHLPEISALIDPEQFQLITADEAQLVVIRGVAGSGKTTVALHRLAYLNYKHPGEFRANRMMVIVWGKALQRFISKVLPALGVKGVAVRTFAEWSDQIRARLYPFMPTRKADDTPAVVTRLKLHPAMLRILEDYVSKNPDWNYASRAVEDWSHILTSRAMLKKGLKKYAPGAFSDHDLDRILRWTVRQVDLVNEYLQIRAEADDMDAEDVRRVQDEVFLDDEDDPLLLRLWQLRVGPVPYRGTRGKPLRYRHLVIDEAQDLSPLEVRVLMDCTTSERSMTLAGDTQQHVLQEAGFTDWNEFFGHLGVKGTAVSTLRVSYRSTQPIVQFALDCLGSLVEDEDPPSANRGGAPVEIFGFSDHGESSAFLAEVLHGLIAEEPNASVALLARTPEQAGMYYNGLQQAALPRLAWVRQQDFAFAPGIEITDVTQAKGLEFDYVILLDVSAEAWPDTPAARRQLHVGATRAAHQLWVTFVGEPSPILPPHTAKSP
jgi:DNA helicase-2/ATP-dependent DNA helicase PcrA